MIKSISYITIETYIQLAKREGLCFARNTKYYGYYKDDLLCGFGGLLEYKNKVVFKSIYVLPGYRRQGIFKELLNYLIAEAIDMGIKMGEANCTEMSIREFRKRGFVEIKKYKNCIKVKHENLQ